MAVELDTSATRVPRFDLLEVSADGSDRVAVSAAHFRCQLVVFDRVAVSAAHFRCQLVVFDRVAVSAAQPRDLAVAEPEPWM